MSSILEGFKAELLALLKEPDYDDAIGIDVANIRRSHKTTVTRENAPAVHLYFERATKTGEAGKGCNWKWRANWRISVFTRGDQGDAISDPLVLEILERIGSKVEGTVPFEGVRPDVDRIDVVEEIADTDATRVDIEGTAAYESPIWSY